MTIRTRDEETGKDIRYEPFIERGADGTSERAGFTVQFGGKERKIYLETCENEPLCWVHTDDPIEDGEPVLAVAAEWEE